MGNISWIPLNLDRTCVDRNFNKTLISMLLKVPASIGLLHISFSLSLECNPPDSHNAHHNSLSQSASSEALYGSVILLFYCIIGEVFLVQDIHRTRFPSYTLLSSPYKSLSWEELKLRWIIQATTNGLLLTRVLQALSLASKEDWRWQQRDYWNNFCATVICRHGWNMLAIQ